MKTTILFIYLTLGSLLLFSQTGIRINGARIVVTSGAILQVSGSAGDVVNSSESGSDGSIELEGTLSLEGDWENNATGGDLLDGTGGEIVFNGNSSQKIKGTRTTHFAKVKLNEDVEILSDYTISNKLDLASGCLILGDNNITLSSSATVVNYGAGHYVRTVGAGALIRNVNAGGSAVLYPVGNTSSYLPISLQQSNGGGSGNFQVKLIDGVWSDGTSGTDISQTKEAVNKTWLIESNLSSLDLTMIIQWNASDEVNGFDRANCYISHFENGEWDEQTRISSSGSGPYTISRSGVTSLSPYTVAGDNMGSPLPVDLLSFEIMQTNLDVDLHWVTVSETNNMGFEIQRSIDMVNFESIGFVNGAGNSLQVLEYDFTDLSPFKILGVDKIYYRLKQIDYDHNYRLSNVEVAIVDNEGDKFVSLYPNPTSGIINISTNMENIKTIRIINLMGEIISSFDNYNKYIDLTSYSKGVYIIELGDGEDKVVRRIIRK